ncbi:hypothetical protein C5L38_34630 (plasmid) [Streptomyces sp. WAC00288]|uniref:hypothetical protein n=1 Tax=unclassified Streptomyces TaxID=2593676 RepID=UPI000788A387|nr:MULTISPECIES: hypothetical protein [unclassified Streptomyces]AVI00194.1 hypothetical protein C5L38_34630 [Streptomyces sp. WAC00288]KYG51087.1 hypothetical protein AWI43_32015 [Streptomyces sp. WAC04657]
MAYYEVNVPMRSVAGNRGVHVFTGMATDPGSAIRIAQQTYRAAQVAQQAGRAIPGKSPDGWGARGYRPGWQLDWRSATAALWRDLHGWPHRGAIRIAY